MLPFSAEFPALAESPLISKVTPVAVIAAPVASLFNANAAYASLSLWSLHTSVPPLTVICAFGDAIFTTLRPVSVELLIVTIALGAVVVTFTV